MISTLTRVDDQVIDKINQEKAIRKTSEIFLLFSLGSQFDHLIKQMLDKIGVFCLVADPGKIRAEDVEKIGPIGIILSGGPVSVYENPPPFDCRIFDLGIPVLGICLGFQLWAQHVGCKVIKSDKREFGVHSLILLANAEKFLGDYVEMPVLESHGDKVASSGDWRFSILGRTENAEVAAASFKHLWGVQFHPEVPETIYGQQIFESFCFKICKAKDRFPAKNVALQKIAELRKQIGNKKVLLALSGGSDSSTLAYLLWRALVGKRNQLRAVYIKGIDRPDDEAHVIKYFAKKLGKNLVIVDATQDFLSALAGITDGHEKRVAMRRVYRNVLEQQVRLFKADFIAQGTLYTDNSESGGGYDSGAKKAQIKLHHNVGLDFSVPEITPLDDQVKDTGRDIGRAIGVPEALLTRHPFPGPGLVVRIEGEVTAERLRIARRLDGIYIEELRRAGLYEKVWQAGVELTVSERTCTKGDDAFKGKVATVWAVESVNGFTARSADLPKEFRRRVAQRMTNEIYEIGYVQFGESDKPPATIEWE